MLNFGHGGSVKGTDEGEQGSKGSVKLVVVGLVEITRHASMSMKIWKGRDCRRRWSDHAFIEFD